jgi:hypothetical protein
MDLHFFEHQCVGAFKQVADTTPSFFKDVIELFNGRPVQNHYNADISLMIYPLPLLPMLICYNRPEVFVAKPLSGKVPNGTVEFHPAFKQLSIIEKDTVANAIIDYDIAGIKVDFANPAIESLGEAARGFTGFHVLTLLFLLQAGLQWVLGYRSETI